MTDIIDRIKAFEVAIQPYSPGLSTTISFDLNHYMHYATLHINSRYADIKVHTAEDKQALDQIISRFKDVIGYVHIYDNLPAGLAVQDIMNCRFNHFESLVLADMQSFIENVYSSSFNDQIYCLTVWLDLGNYGIDYHVNNEKIFNDKLKAKKSGDHVAHYQVEKNTLNYRYLEHTSLSQSASEAVNQQLNVQQGIIEQHYERYGEPYLIEISALYAQFYIDHVANTINQLRPEINKLNLTDDFIVFIRFYDEDEITHYQALRKTVPYEQIKKLLLPLYRDFLQ